MPDYRSYPRVKLEATESQIEMQIGHYLRVKGFCFYKQNTRGFFDTRLKKFRKDQNPYALTGLPDYAILYKGFHLGMEIKKSTGRQSENQKTFEKFITEKGGASYCVVKSLEAAIESVENFTRKVDSIYEHATKQGPV